MSAPRRVSLHPFALALVLGLPASFGAYFLGEQWRANAIEAAFRPGAAELIQTIHLRLDQIVAELHAVSDFVGPGDQDAVAADEFSRFARAVAKSGDITRTLLWAPQVTLERRAEFEAGERRLHAAGFLVSERRENAIQPAAQRATYFPIQRIEPSFDHDEALGFDLASQAIGRAALEAARDSGTVVATQLLDLWNESVSSRGALVFLPRYRVAFLDGDTEQHRRNLIGFVVAAVRFDALVEEALASIPTASRALLLRDISVPGEEEVVYGPTPSTAPRQAWADVPARRSDLSHQAIIPFAGRKLEAVVVPDASYQARYEGISPLTLLVAGLSTTSLLAAWAWISHRRRELEVAADREQTMELRAAVARLSKFEDRYRVLFEKSHLPTLLIDRANDRILQSNSAACSLFETDPDRLQSLPFSDLARFSLDDAAARMTDSSSDPVSAFRTHWSSRDGRVRELDVRFLPDNSADHLVWVVFDDVSEQATAEAARLAALDAAENLARLKSEFTANVSHELRTPLNGVIGMASLGLRTAELDKAHQAFGRILECGRQLLVLVENLLDFSTLSCGTLVLASAPFRLVDMLERAAARAREAAAAKRLGFHLELSATLPYLFVGDERQLEKVLGHLLENAVKFTDAGTITLSAELDDETLRIRVADSGIGMTGEQTTRLFRPFEQADGSTTRRFGGTGLGLALAHLIVQKMGGTIQVKSTVRQGSTFDVCLPLPAESATADFESPADGHGRLQRVRALVVDDVELNREVLGGLLAREGALVDFASDGRAVLERIGADDGGRYDIVLTDMLMPEMDGCELARRLHGMLPALPVIAVVSDSPSADEHRQGELAGVRAYLMKPIDPETMVLSVRDCLRRLSPTAVSVARPSVGYGVQASAEHVPSSSGFTTGD